MAEKVDFDKHAESYEQQMAKDLRFFIEETGYLAEYKVKIVKETLENKKPLRILEYGCGVGMNINFFNKHFKDSEIYGCDISKKSLEVAEERNHERVKFFLITEENSVKYREFFDVIFVSCVFHHIHPDHRKNSMKNIYNLMKPGGSFYLFEHNPYNLITRKIVNECIWDTDAILLKPDESYNLIKEAGLIPEHKRKYTLFFPGFLRFLRKTEKFLSFLPAGGQYYIKAGRANGSAV